MFVKIFFSFKLDLFRIPKVLLYKFDPKIISRNSAEPNPNWNDDKFDHYFFFLWHFTFLWVSFSQVLQNLIFCRKKCRIENWGNCTIKICFNALICNLVSKSISQVLPNFIFCCKKCRISNWGTCTIKIYFDTLNRNVQS